MWGECRRQGPNKCKGPEMGTSPAFGEEPRGGSRMTEGREAGEDGQILWGLWATVRTLAFTLSKTGTSGGQ